MKNYAIIDYEGKVLEWHDTKDAAEAAAKSIVTEQEKTVAIFYFSSSWEPVRIARHKGAL